MQASGFYFELLRNANNYVTRVIFFNLIISKQTSIPLFSLRPLSSRDQKREVSWLFTRSSLGIYIIYLHSWKKSNKWLSMIVKESSCQSIVILWMLTYSANREKMFTYCLTRFISRLNLYTIRQKAVALTRRLTQVVFLSIGDRCGN